MIIFWPNSWQERHYPALLTQMSKFKTLWETVSTWTVWQSDPTEYSKLNFE